MDKWYSSFKRAGTLTANFLFPPFCPACETYLGIRSDPRTLCSSCRRKLEQNAQGPFVAPKNTLSIEGFYALGAYGSEPLTTLIHKIKYQRKEWVLEALRPAMAGAVARSNLSRIIDVAVPVPLYPSRLRERGFNQAQLIALELGHILNIPIEPHALKRIRATKPQMSLREPAQRRRNVQRAFEAHCTESLKDRTILLVDDVTTTGATLQECAKALHAAGANKIFAFVLAI